MDNRREKPSYRAMPANPQPIPVWRAPMQTNHFQIRLFTRVITNFGRRPACTRLLANRVSSFAGIWQTVANA
jgi:hypothetical protein